MGTVPVAPSTKPPIGKTLPIVLALTGVVALIGVSTAYNVMTGSGHKQEAAKSTLPARPSTADTEQVDRCRARATPAGNGSNERARAGDAGAGAGNGSRATDSTA
jgi:hypothetical protein